ncbi:XRE family transcriptional regulator [Paracoccus sanguinis]|uniref:XRE family transcriptional regulator n=1 Tax=Paracoccus sanguinis TaxID=1545044 RepID=UPI000B2C9E6D|nr:S24 family peptidase [Paracoccus sanguinis]
MEHHARLEGEGFFCHLASQGVSAPLQGKIWFKILNSSTTKVQDFDRGRRILAERERLGLSQPAFAERGGVSKGSQILYEKGKAPTADYLAAIAQHGADVSFILTGKTPSDRLAALTADALHVADDFASIPIHDAFLAAGYSAQNDTEAVIGHLAFRRDWLDRMGIAADKARIARVRGDSMAPTLHDDDMVLIDTGSREVAVRKRGPEDRRLPPIYAVNTADGPRIKRVERPETGQMQLLSDNNEFPVEVLTGDRLKRAEIIGRVVWWGHTVRE